MLQKKHTTPAAEKLRFLTTRNKENHKNHIIKNSKLHIKRSTASKND